MSFNPNPKKQAQEVIFSRKSKAMSHPLLGLIRKLQNLLPRTALITLYKDFVRPHLDYGNIFYDQAQNASFHQKLESLQYNACSAIT